MSSVRILWARAVYPTIPFCPPLPAVSYWCIYFSRRRVATTFPQMKPVSVHVVYCGA